MQKFRCLNEVFNGTGQCETPCDTCTRVAGVLRENMPPLNTDVLVLLNLGQIRVGQWNGTAWRVHADGHDRYILNVDGWMPLPEVKDFYR